MEFWEFLIQKEGDRSWLPLESPSVEVLEGRYRVVARSSRSNTPTEIRVTHYATDETPPVRRVRKRSGQTNPDGLIVILPFTRLQSGLWELRCTGDLMAEMLGENWQYTVQLDVLPLSASDDSEPDDLDPIQPDWQMTTAMGVATIAEVDQPLAQLDQPADEAQSVEQSAEQPVEQPAPALFEPAAAEATSEETTPEPVYTESEFAEPAVEIAPEPVSLEPVVPESVMPEATVSAAASPVETTEPIEPEAELHSEVESTGATEIPVAETPTPQLAQVLQQVEQNSQQLVDSIFENLRDFTGAVEAPPSAASSKAASLEVASPINPPLRVILERETFVIQRGQPLDLVGRVELATEASDQTAEQIVVSELRVQLHDPQTSELLMDEVHPVNNRTLPFQFSGTISLPEHYQTYLVLGKLIFQGGTTAGAQQLLAIRSFNVTTDLHELIESVANDFPDLETLASEALPETAEPLLQSELTRLSSYQRSSQQPLPPQLRPAQPSGRTHATLDLPSFQEPEPTLVGLSAEQGATGEGAAVQLGLEETELQDGDLDPAEISTSAADLLPALRHNPDRPDPDRPESDRPEIDTAQAPETSIDTPTEAADRVAPEPLFDWNELDQRLPLWGRQPQVANLSNDPEDISFRALNWQNRFLERLQALATNPEASVRLGLIEAESGAGEALAGASNGVSATETLVAKPQIETSPEIPQRRRFSGLDAELTAHEIVVDDEVIPRADEAEPDADDQPIGPVLPADEPIPTPRLQLPTGEMVAGEPIPVTVKLPSLLARVYVKLWLRDRQTRELLGTPRWIIDFVPDGFGNQMARTEVIVPPGCLKAQFEAIAVEIATQRESDKVTLTRPIVPPDLSPLSLDRLEI
jgi:hypothetical protein